MTNDVHRDLMGEGDPDRADGFVQPESPEVPEVEEGLPDAGLEELLARSRLGETDLGNTKRLRRAYRETAIFVPGKGWAVRDVARYSFRAGPQRAHLLAQSLGDLVRQEADAQLEREVSDFEARRATLAERDKGTKARWLDVEAAADVIRGDRRDTLLKWAKGCESRGRINAALEMWEGRAVVDVEDLDRDAWSFTCPNGRVDLRAAATADFDGLDRELELAERAAWLRPQDWAGFPTKCAGVPYDPAAQCPGWEAFLELILPDAEVRAYWQRICGLTVFGRNEAQACILLRGPGGNGKSTATGALRYVLGTRDGYGAGVNVGLFLTSGERLNVTGPNPEEVALVGARAMFASEPSPKDAFSAKAIKSFVSGDDSRMVRGLHKDPFEYIPQAVPFISFNRTPKIQDEDEGTRRRLFFVPFSVSLGELPEDRQRSSGDVMAELTAEGSGILNWMLDGFRAWQALGGTAKALAPPGSVLALKSELMAGADPVGQFLAACTEPTMGSRVGVTELHRTFLAWAEETGSAPWSARALGSILVEKGLHKVKSNAYHWEPLAWRDDELTNRLRNVANDTPPPPEPPEPDDRPPPF